MAENNYKGDFKRWCNKEHIKITDNTEVFFVNTKKTIMPAFRIGSNIYVHFVDELIENDYDVYEMFAKSFNTIMIIEKGIVSDMIKHFSKSEISKHFKIRL